MSVVDLPAAGSSTGMGKFGKSEFKNLNFGINRDPTQLDRDFQSPSLAPKTIQKHNRTYSNLPVDKKFDYTSDQFMHRYMGESAQKKTGFRQLLNSDKDSLKQELTNSMLVDTVRNNPRCASVTGSAEMLMYLQEHDYQETDHVKIPQKKIEKDDYIRGIKNTYKAPDMTLLPESKFRESYLKLLNSQEKPFNKKVNEQEFYDALNIIGLHEKRYKNTTYELLRRSQQKSVESKHSLCSDASVEVKQGVLSTPASPRISNKKSIPMIKSDGVANTIEHQADGANLSVDQQDKCGTDERVKTDQQDDYMENEDFDQMSTSQKIQFLKNNNVGSQFKLPKLGSDVVSSSTNHHMLQCQFQASKKLQLIEKIENEILLQRQLKQFNKPNISGINFHKSNNFSPKNINSDNVSLVQNNLAVDSVKKRFGNTPGFGYDLNFMKRNLDKEISENSKQLRNFNSTPGQEFGEPLRNSTSLNYFSRNNAKSLISRGSMGFSSKNLSALDQYVDIRLPFLGSRKTTLNMRKNFDIFQDNGSRQIKQFEVRNLDLQARIAKQMEAAKDFEHFYTEQQKLIKIQKKIEENETLQKDSHINIQKKNLDNVQKSTQSLRKDYDEHLTNVLSRKVSPPGQKGIESITALGYPSSSPISNFYCEGYKNLQKYSLDNFDRKKHKEVFKLYEKNLMQRQNYKKKNISFLQSHRKSPRVSELPSPQINILDENHPLDEFKAESEKLQAINQEIKNDNKQPFVSKLDFDEPKKIKKKSKSKSKSKKSIKFQ